LKKSLYLPQIFVLVLIAIYHFEGADSFVIEVDKERLRKFRNDMTALCAFLQQL
jgi:hypothetical protein